MALEIRVTSPTDDAFVEHIVWNADEIAKEVAEKVGYYKNLVYTEDQVAEAKKDRAKLNKFVKALKDKDREIKDRCLAPYEEFHNQMQKIIALVEELPEDLLNLLLMVLIGRTHELVIGRIHKIPDSADFTCSLIYEFLGRDASFCSLILDLLSVFIGTSHEEYIISFLTTIACNRICEYNLVGISDVRLA